MVVGEERERLVRELERSLFQEWVLVEGFLVTIALVTSEDMKITFLETGSGMGEEAENERADRLGIHTTQVARLRLVSDMQNFSHRLGTC